jgi:hypothetical protein
MKKDFIIYAIFARIICLFRGKYVGKNNNQLVFDMPTGQRYQMHNYSAFSYWVSMGYSIKDLLPE